MKHRAMISIISAITISIALFFCPETAYSEISITENKANKLILDNGLTLILKQDQRTPTFSASLFIRTGSATEGEYAGSGITHLIEHLIFKGTPDESSQDIENKIKSLGGDIGAYTSFDYTAFKMQGPRDNIISLIDIFYNIISNPAFDTKEIDKEKDVIKREMGFVYDDVQKYLTRKLWQAAYMRHPYKNPIIGYKDIFSALTQDDIKNYYSKSYIPNNMVLVVVGDIDIPSLNKKITKTFGSLKMKSLTALSLPSEPNQLTPRVEEISYPTSKTYMTLGFHSVGLSNKDLYALDILSIILGGGASSILYQELHNRLNLVYGINAYNYTPFNPGLFIITTTFEPGKKKKVEEEIFKKIADLKNSPIKTKELDKAKNQVISAYLFSKQTQESQATDLGVSQLLTGDMDFSSHYVDGVSSVTSGDILRVASQYLDRNSMTQVLLLPTAIAKMQSIVKPKPITTRTVVKKTLPNGVRLILSEDKTLPVVSINVCIKGGLRVENELNNGISNLLASMLTKGTGARTEEELFELVESLGGDLSSYSANNSFGISLDMMSKDFKKAMEIVADIMTRPAFRKEKLRILKDDVLAEIKLMDDDVFFVTQKHLKKELFGSHPYSMLSAGTEKSVKSISRRDVVDFFKRYCVGSNVVISICGDIDIDNAYSLGRSKFKGIRKKREDRPIIPKAKLTHLTDVAEINSTVDKEQSVIMIGFQSAGASNPDRYPLQILSSIFSGSGGRLFQNIRDKKALAYTLGAFGMTGIDTGSFIFYAAAKEDDIDSVRSEIFSQIEAVNSGDITEEEIDSAKKSLIAKYQIGLQSTGAFALKVALDELFGLGYDNYILYPGIIGKISREEVTQIANSYFTTKACAVSITTPKSKPD